MTKPKNMTSEQEAIWKESERLRRSAPEYKEKCAIRSRRYYDKHGHKDIVIAKTKAARTAPGGKEHRNLLERERLQQSPELKDRSANRQKQWRSTPQGAQKNREKSARYAERKGHYDQFLTAMDNGDA